MKYVRHEYDSTGGVFVTYRVRWFLWWTRQRVAHCPEGAREPWDDASGESWCYLFYDADSGRELSWEQSTQLARMVMIADARPRRRGPLPPYMKAVK